MTLMTKIIDVPLHIKEQAPFTSWNLKLIGHDSQITPLIASVLNVSYYYNTLCKSELEGGDKMMKMG